MTTLELRRSPTVERIELPRRHRHALLIAGAVALVLVPWCVLLSQTLPAVATVQHWSAAWVGLDSGEAIAAILTVLLILHRDPRAALTATAGAAFLLADAWFDICTSAPGFDQGTAIVEAAIVEIPLAVAALWFASRNVTRA
ncbi:MAG TPA: hypothetical protein VHX59_20315 [Mycobacteriales bacterium]|nr:hypothetical protein [Mycobacteriales bacterium]